MVKPGLRVNLKDIQKRSPPFGKGRTGGDTGALEKLKNMEGG
jgi:hypothetical protein